MLQIVGGCYFETCLSPSVRQFYGSGGRAAAALAGRRDDVVLHTYETSATSKPIRRLAALSGFAVRTYPSHDALRFDYVHPLRSTMIIPPPQTLRPAESFTVAGDLVLQFGTLEGSPRVDGRLVVYDPQDGVAPRSFRAMGSRAERLAILCNRGEAAALTGERDPDIAAAALLATEGAEVVVVKGAAQGAVVLTSDGARAGVPAYASRKVFGIGSGDIFAAAFFLFWGGEGHSAARAADLASRAVSHYVGSRDEKLATAEFLNSELHPAPVAPGRVYLAAPFFNMAQLWLVEEARAALASFGLEVFSPLHEVGWGAAGDVAPADLAGLEGCDRVFAIVDGLDAGTLFEIGYARKMGLPVVAYGETIAEENCKMISGSGCVLEPDFATAIYRTAWARKP